MTATEYQGRKVIATEAVLTPLSTPQNPVTYKQTVLLLLDDDTEVYGCNHDGCGYASERIGSVRSHLVVHNGPRKKSTGRPPKASVLLDYPVGQIAIDMRELTLDDILGLADQQLQQDQSVLVKLRDDRDAWKQRAKDAEGKLNKVKKAWQALTGDDPLD